MFNILLVLESARLLPFLILQLFGRYRALDGLECGGFVRFALQLAFLLRRAGFRPLAGTLEALNRSRALPALMQWNFLLSLAVIRGLLLLARSRGILLP